MVLRFKHIQHVRAEGLGRFDNIRTRRVPCLTYLEISRGPVHLHPRLEERIDELRRRGKISLIGRQDVAARIAPGGICLLYTSRCV